MKTAEGNNTDASTIEQLLDYAAKTLSNNQAYVGCVLFYVKDYLQDMIKMKNKDYAINYMNKHWPKIDLNRVL